MWCLTAEIGSGYGIECAVEPVLGAPYVYSTGLTVLGLDMVGPQLLEKMN